jgi:two-component system, LytTR family, response regulator
MRQPAPSLPLRVLITAAAVLLYVAYWLIFAITTSDGIIGSMGTALNNAAPAIALAFITHAVLDRFVWSQAPLVQLAAQIPAALAFAFVWYLAILVIRGLRAGWTETGFSVAPFAPVAFYWQMFQGVTFYGLVALASLAIVMRRRIAVLVEQAQQPRPERAVPKNILVKTQDETHNVALDEIVTVSGAGDYVELVLADRTLLSSTRLSRFEALLPESQFVRAHRSHLVRIGAITRTEPAGNGRTVLHLLNGSSIVTSRAGARLVRDAAL